MSPPDCDRLVDLLRPGMRVFVHGGTAESGAFTTALQRAPHRAAGVEFVGVFVPGLNELDFAALDPTARATTSFVSPTSRASFEAGRHDFVPLHYSALPGFLESRPLDLAILHLPPDEHGVFSWGINADLGPIATAQARRVAVIVNGHLPRTRGEAGLDKSRVDLLVDGEVPLRRFASAAPDAASEAIARRVASLVEDGDTIQFGIGKVPAAVLPALRSRRRLAVHSGLIADEIADLVEAGAIGPNGGASDRPPIIAGMAVGTERAWALAERPEVAFHSIRTTHNLALIAAIDNFVAINSAVEVDLFGQVNGELVGGRQISGVGGAADFARAARESRGGRSIVALPATARGRSRLLAKLDGPVGMTRADADIVVTEFGIARLRHLPLDARAEALIAIAAPEHRAALDEAWGAIRRTL